MKSSKPYILFHFLYFLKEQFLKLPGTDLWLSPMKKGRKLLKCYTYVYEDNQENF